MSSPQMMHSGRTLPPAALVTSRIIWFGLMTGPLAFAAVITQLHPQQSLTDQQQNVLLIVDVVFLVLAIGVVLIVPRLLIKPDTDDQTLARRCSTVLILQMAPLEGVSFVGLVLIFLSGHWWPAIIVPAIAMAIQLTRFPRSTIRTG